MKIKCTKEEKDFLSKLLIDNASWYWDSNYSDKTNCVPFCKFYKNGECIAKETTFKLFGNCEEILKKSIEWEVEPNGWKFVIEKVNIPTEE